MDLETELSRVLRDHAVADPVADPVAPVHSGMRRRRRRQRLQVLGSALAVMALAAGTATLVQDHRGGRTLPTPGTSTAVEVGPLVVTDVDLVGQAGFAIGRFHCDQGECTSLLVSNDGGATWARRTGQGLPPTCSETVCVQHVRFANDRVGYAYSRGLWITSDSGRTWSRITTAEVDDLTISGSTAYRVATQTPGCRPGCTYLVQSSEVGSVVWHTLRTEQASYAGFLSVHGDRLVLPFYVNHAGGSDAPNLVLRSLDGGRTWDTAADPCRPTTASPVSDVLAFDAGPDTTAVAVCSLRGNTGPSTVVRSTDGGSTWAARGTFAPFPTTALAVLGPDRVLAVEHVNGDEEHLMLSTDGGQTFARVATAADGEQFASLRFSSAADGTWLLRDGSGFQRTSDGGATWTTVRFAG